MTDEIQAPAAAPVVETPVASPAAPVVAASVPITPVAPAAPAATPVEAPQVAPEASTEQPTPTVLGDALKEANPPEAAPEAPKTEEKPVDAKTEEKQEGQSDEPAPPPTFDEFTLPEGSQAAPELVKEFTDILGSFEAETKAEHAKVQEFGQKAVDFYTREVQKEIQKVNDLYRQNWENIKVKWKDDFLGDPELGGNRAQTTLDSALNCIRACGGTPEEQAEFRQLMDQSGLGNNKVMIRILANAGRVLSEGKPLTATTPIAAPKSKVHTMYGGKR